MGFFVMRIFLLMVFIGICLPGICQVNLENFTISNPEDKNIIVQELYSDSLSSSFLIVVQESVKLHKHAFHTEQVYVLEGKGKMKVGKKEFQIYPGSLIFIPKDTPHNLVVTESPVKVISVQSPEFTGKDRIMLE